MMSGDGGWWIVMLIWMAAFWSLVLGGAGWLVWRLSQHTQTRGSTDEILKRRLVQGEIDAGQYRIIQEDLANSEGGGPTRKRALRVPVAWAGAVAVMLLFVAPALAALAGDWDMSGHMDGMMGRGKNASDTPLVIGGRAEAVEMEDSTFSPGNLQVPAGATVTWTNRDSVPHDAAAVDGSWKTKMLSRSESGSLTFDRPGEYEYYCTVHPSMKARLSVK